jgi:hypothetical protein
VTGARLDAAVERARDAGGRAVMLLDDPGDVLADDETTQRAQLASYCDAIVAAMLTAAASGAHAELERLRALVARSLAAIDAPAAELLRSLYQRDGSLDRVGEAGESPRAARRRHAEALAALARALLR